MEIYIWIASLFLVHVNDAAGSQLIVSLPDGKVEGYNKKTASGKVYSAFEGIPYARAPLGMFKFEDPKPVQPWLGTWQAKTLTKCMQYYHYTEPGDDYVIGDEDCLHVNVYTPEINDGKFRDVIVFIHGGAFMFNSGGTYGEKYLMEYDVVFVTFNYRLGPLGFLSTEDQNIPGNAGLKDQILALKWIQENIRYFGGNANKTTLTGMSAGGASAHIHTLSPQTRDRPLFNRVIAQSGTALNPWVIVEKSREKATHLAQLVGCPTYDIKEMAKCLKARPARQIVTKVKHFQPWLYNPFSPFGVVVDTWSVNPVLPEHPYIVLKKKHVLQVPIIFSNVQAEGLYPAAEFAVDGHLNELNTRWNDLVPFILDYNNTVIKEEINEVSQKIRKFYFGDSSVSNETFYSFVQMVTDRLFLSGIQKAVQLHALANTDPVYHYFYSYRAANSKSDARTKSKINYGTSHGDDTIMVLSAGIDTTSTSEDVAMSNILQGIWLSFAKYGVPKVNTEKWDPVSTNPQNPLKYLMIKSPMDIKMQSDGILKNTIFWESLPIKENQWISSVKGEL